jgi:ketosteroid isomerase-like protein
MIKSLRKGAKMTNIRFAAFVYFALILIMAGCSEQQIDIDRENALLLDQDKEWSKAIAGADIDKVLNYWTDDAVIYTPQGTAVRGKEEIRKFVERSRSQWGLSLKTNPQEALVFPSGDAGYTTGTYRFSGTDANGDSISLPGQYLSVWQKSVDGEWKCVLEFHSDKTEPIENKFNMDKGLSK